MTYAIISGLFQLANDNWRVNICQQIQPTAPTANIGICVSFDHSVFGSHWQW